MEKNDLKVRALEQLKKFYGYNGFRAGQFEVIQAVMGGRDVVVIMPTGGGKSMCYQMPALLSEGCAVVVSPLIALMEDQVTALIANGIPAAALNSNRDERLNRGAIDAAIAGRIKLLYVSPERLVGDMDVWLDKLNISLFAIDEAHCISQWGHDFRPVYTKLAAIKEHFPNVPIMALTASADRVTRDDIARQLGLKNPLRWLGSFNRPNLSLRVEIGATQKRKIKEITTMIARYPDDSGIVYTLSRAGAEQVHESLLRLGYRSCLYHAGLSAKARNEAQRAFTNGDVQVVCATIAFGMGIDKSNIRWVIHNNLPGNIESYYQEIGRAGRDGMSAETVLFYSIQDMIMRRKFIEDSGQPAVTAEKLRQMQAFAEAQICRRRVLLSYFGEQMEHDCGNCDVCKNPPERFDGSELVQKAGSAILRTDSKIGVFMLVDILRGSMRAELRRLGYDRIKTYGVGRDLSSDEWRAYITQMVQLGLFEIDIENSNILKVTDFGMQVVRGVRKVELAAYRPPERAKKKEPKQLFDVPIEGAERLFEELKQMRRKLAAIHGIAPYMVFSDKTLHDMANRCPLNMDDFLEVNGVGELKALKFGSAFIKVIRNFKG